MLIGVKNIAWVTEEARLQGQVDVLVHVRDQIVFTERNKVVNLEADYQRVMQLSLEMLKKLNKQLSTTVDEYEIEEDEEIF